MTRRLVLLALTLIFASFSAMAVENKCMSGMCGDWTSKDNGSFTITAAFLRWNKHEFKRCYIVAQDPRLSIVKCTQVQNVGMENIHDVTVYFYLRAVNPWTMQVIYANHLPEHCVADTNCWPSSGMFFHRVREKDTADTNTPAPAPETKTEKQP